jgi:Protein of unknown function (DUF3551)
MRILLIAAVAVTALSLHARPGAAAEGPWCAFLQVGTEAVYEDCQYRTFEECRPQILAGNRGFCNPNPRWTEPVPKSKSTRHRRHVERG